MSKGKNDNDNDNSNNTSFIGDVFSVIDRAMCESTKGSWGDVCPHDVNVGGNVYDPSGNGDYGGEGARHTDIDRD